MEFSLALILHGRGGTDSMKMPVVAFSSEQRPAIF